MMLEQRALIGPPVVETLVPPSGPPARLRLSRAAGFRLQALSLSLNNRPAVNVARPGRWGNPFTAGPPSRETNALVLRRGAGPLRRAPSR